MMKINPDADGDAEIFWDDETLQGNQFTIRLDDQHGMELLAQLVDFYEVKGLKPMILLNRAAAQTRRAWWRRIFFGGK